MLQCLTIHSSGHECRPEWTGKMKKEGSEVAELVIDKTPNLLYCRGYVVVDCVDAETEHLGDSGIRAAGQSAETIDFLTLGR